MDVKKLERANILAKSLLPKIEELLNMSSKSSNSRLGDAICEYCNKNIIPEHNLGIGCLCEGNWCEEAQDGYTEENNIELED